MFPIKYIDNNLVWNKDNEVFAYYELMTESEIANLQKITQSGVFKNRHHALETMKKILKEKQ